MGKFDVSMCVWRSGLNPLSATFKVWTPQVASLNRMLIVFFISVALYVILW
jgi:hypothetical protein